MSKPPGLISRKEEAMPEMHKLFLSKLILNPRSNQVRRDLSDCQSVHRRILSAFPKVPGEGAKAREHFGVLHRLDLSKDSEQSRLALLVQSNLEPDWTVLPEDYCLETGGEPNPVCKLVTQNYAAVQSGMTLRFRLRANPTRRVSSRCESERDPRFYGRRVELYREEDQIAWLGRKAEAHGFRLLAVKVNRDVLNLNTIPESKIKGRRSDTEKPVTFGSALFEGRLAVTDADRLREALAQGIGSGKAYGFGLLSIARLPE
jgi:CRISPR system Cascade subunit CasE